MKKLLLVAGALAAISFASCKKECTCDVYLMGAKVETITEKSKSKCSELTNVVEDEVFGKTGAVCK